MATKFISDKIRVSYAFLTKPKQNDRGEDKFSATILMPKSDTKKYAELRACEREAAEKKFPGKPAAFYTAIKSVIHDGDGLRPTGEPFGPECKGHWVFTASTGDRPGCIDENLQPLMEPIKSGDYCRVSINMYGFDTAGNRGVAAGLNNVQLLERGESLGGRSDAVSDFASF